MHLSPQAEHAVRKRHPWVFRKGVASQSAEGSPGDLAVLFDRKREFLGIGLYDPDELIRVRVLQFGKQMPVDAAFFEGRLRKAAEQRLSLLRRDTNAYRVVNGENDLLPGLIIDRYAETAVIKIYTPAWIPHLKDIVNGLDKVMSPENIVLRLSNSIQSRPEYAHGLTNGISLKGSCETVVFKENGILFEADPVNGQKTGFFLDQRDNRSRAEALAEGKTVLNVFSYTGGFSIYAARGGALSVASLDISKPAIEAAKRNFELNRENNKIASAEKEFIAEDAFEALSGMYKAGRAFDMVIIDPPSFAKKQADVKNALSAYARLVKMGLNVLNPGGTFIMASCSSRISPEMFFTTVGRAASETGRRLNEIEKTAHALDHPVKFEEGRYLKCLFSTAL
ncbi:MAG: hypothetical protein A2017_07470 [Lentisphaerae bacterium GWF2_44_16]|nr:MAG: hypothetical protein A2017_07470 [Lentisphaerae bacterium GWF2_44_16]